MRVAMVMKNLTEKDNKYIVFMCSYLAKRGYIPEAHPTHLMKFALNFLLSEIKKELEEEAHDSPRKICDLCRSPLIVEKSRDVGRCEGCRKRYR